MCCGRQKRVWPGVCVIVSPPVGYAAAVAAGDWLLWNCGECGPQKWFVRSASIGMRLRLYQMVTNRLRLRARPDVEGPMSMDDLIDWVRDLDRVE